jgi:hypothetical protein
LVTQKLNDYYLKSGIFSQNDRPRTSRKESSFLPNPAGPDARSTLPLATLQWRRSIVDETTMRRRVGGGRLLTSRGYNNTIKSAPNAQKDDQKILLNSLMVKENISLEISLLLVTFCSNVV